MAVLKRLNINKFTSEADNDAFIEEIKANVACMGKSVNCK